MTSIYERVRRELARQDKARKAAEHKQGEHARRSAAARISAEIRRENRDDQIISGHAMPRNAREDELQFRACVDLGIEEDFEWVQS